ncbi:hypothetical protein [Aeromonas caviae]|uniref:hypothetical protein n=1 Tax=Aeromonas caviae TaxID=648 RepID=UPI001FC82025|nr:hypothetical protein [Aeromonas caviae]GKR19055.1 hypothetical protein KAM467_20990 [Aeromonas caviae]
MSLQNMTQDELQKLIAEAVRQTLLQMGADPSDPIEMQRDFQHLRQWRTAGENLKRQGTMTLLGIFITGTVALLLVGVRDYFQH